MPYSKEDQEIMDRNAEKMRAWKIKTSGKLNEISGNPHVNLVNSVSAMMRRENEEAAYSGEVGYRVIVIKGTIH